ncbi:hypothetical protein Mapa_001235 [Marchantia paleacea]|nr:hypothetical protein Mapa_001235 [Marchantia paleacea]
MKQTETYYTREDESTRSDCTEGSHPDPHRFHPKLECLCLKGLVMQEPCACQLQPTGTGREDI